MSGETAWYWTGLAMRPSYRVLSHSTEKELPLLREAADIVVDGTMDTTPVLVALEALMADGEESEQSLILIRQSMI